MKILCVCLNSKYIHSCLAPWCLKAGVDAFCDNSHECKVIESTINASQEETISKIKNETPALVAFSCYIWNIESVLQISHEIKKSCKCTIVFGGPEVAYRPHNILNEYDFVDYVLTGEGEWCFAELINTITSKSEFSNVRGLTYRKDGRIISIPEKFYYDTPPSPYCDDYFSSLNGRIAYFESSRGCPFNCAFCLSGRISPLRYFDFERVSNDLIRLSYSGTKTIKFVDRTFNADVNKCNKLLTFIKDNIGTKINKNVCFHFEINADTLKESTMNILHEMPSDLVQLEIGIQSFNEDTLRKIGRSCNTERLYNNIKSLISYRNMHIHIDLIAGLPEEDINSFKDSFNKAYDLKANMLQLGFLKLLHGSKMRDDQKSFPCEYNTKPPYEVSSTPFMREEDLLLLKGCESALDKLYNSGRFLFSLDYLTNKCKISPFDLFCSFGNNNQTDKVSLKDLVRSFYLFFKDKCNASEFREAILCDLACSNCNIQLPDELLLYDKRYKTLKKHFSEKYNENVRIVILNSCNNVYVVRSSAPFDINGRKKGEIHSLHSFM